MREIGVRNRRLGAGYVGNYKKLAKSTPFFQSFGSVCAKLGSEIDLLVRYMQLITTEKLAKSTPLFLEIWKITYENENRSHRCLGAGYIGNYKKLPKSTPFFLVIWKCRREIGIRNRCLCAGYVVITTRNLGYPCFANRTSLFSFLFPCHSFISLLAFL